MVRLLECQGTELYELGKDLVTSGISFRCEVRGWSMYPSIKDGDVVQIAPVRIGEIDVGEVVFFRSGDRLLAHRVTGYVWNEQGVLLKARGDGFRQEDPPIDEADLLGRVEIVYRRQRRGWRAIRLDRGLHKYLGLLLARSRSVHHSARWMSRSVRRSRSFAKRILAPGGHRQEGPLVSRERGSDGGDAKTQRPEFP